MESMDYNYFSSASQPYQYLGFGGDISNLSQPTTEGHGASRRMEAINAGSFVLGSFDYSAFNPSLGSGFGTAESTSQSPQQLSSLPSGSVDSGIAMDLENDASGRRSSSEEKESMTPAQSRRKAQNRAAQRAFRERKERHVRDLEAKLNLLTTTTSSLQSDNERLKLLLRRAQTENEILRATSASSPTRHHPPSFVDDPSLLPCSGVKDSPSAGSPSTDSARHGHAYLRTETSPPRRLGSTPGSDSHLLSASATWDLLQSHPLYLSGAVDIGEICERLKKMARCEGLGPMFEEDEVRKIIEEVGKNGCDELI